jgi:hypothetical protein
MASADADKQRDRLWGRDIWLDVRSTGDAVSSAAGDLAMASGQDALEQSLIRRFITDPGDYAVLGEYGAGARSFVKERKNRAKRDELAERLRSQALRDDRVDKVAQVLVEQTTDGNGLRIFVGVVPRGAAQPAGKILTIKMELR